MLFFGARKSLSVALSSFNVVKAETESSGGKLLARTMANQFKIHRDEVPQRKLVIAAVIYFIVFAHLVLCNGENVFSNR